MFTGIISDIGTITTVEQRGDLRLIIACGYDVAGIDLGASIACSGACMTVVDKGVGDDGKGWFAIDMSAESVARTASGLWATGGRLNLERAAKLGDELGGHIVTGHVDGVGEIVAVRAEGDSMRLTIAVPADIAPYIAPKGSITLDGISLTVNEVSDEDGTTFGLNIIPHTAEWTTLGGAQVGRKVNLEIDILARYLKRMRDYAAV
jgi:riboflavin synthase